MGEKPREVEVIFAGETVARAAASRWSSAQSSSQVHPALRFDVWLPPAFADGMIRSITIIADDGSEVGGSPIAVATADEGEAEVYGDCSGDIPLAEFAGWKTRRDADRSGREAQSSVAVVIVGFEASDLTRSSVQASPIVGPHVFVATPIAGSAVVADVKALDRWITELPQIVHIVAFCKSGFVFSDGGLARLAGVAADDPSVDFLSCDYEIQESDGRRWPVLLPACDPERQMEQGYAAQVFAASRGTAAKALAADGSTLYSIALEAMLETPGERRRHLSGPVGSIAEANRLKDADQVRAAAQGRLRRTRTAALLTVDRSLAWPRVRVVRQSVMSETTIVLLSNEDAAGLKQSIEALAGKLGTADDPGFIVLDNASSDRGVREHLAKLPASRRIVLGSHKTPAVLANEALRIAKGRFVLLVRAGCSPVTDDWLQELMGRASAPGVGAVAPIVLSREGAVVDCGQVITNEGPATAFDGLMDGQRGYTETLATAHRHAAASGLCLLVSKQAADTVGGFDYRRFPESFFAADLCLRLAGRDFATVITPHARFRMRTASGIAPPESAVRTRELELFRRRWPAIDHADPWYPAALSRYGLLYTAMRTPFRDRLISTGCQVEPAGLPAWL